MPTNDYTKTLLNIKDNFISCSNVYTDNSSGNSIIITNATLDYKPDTCPHCGTFHPKLKSKGFQKPSMILLNNAANQTSYLNLKKKRYTCLECNRTFTLSTNEVSKHCFISNNVKSSIALDLTKAVSMKDIASKHNISYNTVSRSLSSYFSNTNPNTYTNYLPTHLCFDGFKSVKNTSGAMSFIFMDASNHKIVDIVENRQLYFLEKYFMKFSKKARDNVKSIVIDMYVPYIVLIKKLFKNAKIIFDKFHIIQHLNRALNKTRIKLMNKDKNNYNKLKNFYKLLLIRRDKLNPIKYKKRKSFNYKMMSDNQVLDYLLSLDDELKATYEYYQEFMLAFDFKNEVKINNLLSNIPNDIFDYMKTALKSMKKNKEYIINAMHSEYTNGPLEGTNNKIKLLKRVSYGFKSFINFKLRIMLHFNLIKKV